MKKILPSFVFLLCVGISGLLPAQTLCPDTTQLGMASNIFTHILNETNPVIYEPDLNTVIFIHRHNALQFGGHSGNLRYDISTDGGATWTLNQGLLNPASVNTTNPARYPNVSIYNPPNNTIPDSAYLVYQGATVAGGNWNGIVTGVRQLDGTGNTENYNQATNTLTLIPRSQVEGKPGEYWAIDARWTGTAINGYRVLKGVWNNTTKDVSWSVNATLVPPFNTVSGSVQASDFCIAFDPTGNIGWICLLTHITPGPTDQSFYPVFYNTTDGGTTWSGPEQVDVGDFGCITNNIGTTSVPTTAFDLDLAVDVNGTPHALVGVGNGSNAYGIFFTQWHAMYDFTRMDGIWNAIQLDTLIAGRGTYGTAPNTTTMDQFSQISRTKDGSKVFFTYVDSRSGLIGGDNIAPDMYGIAYDAVTRTWTTRRNMNFCNPAMTGEIFYPHVSPIAKEGAGTWTLPMVYAQFNPSNEPIDPTDFIYADSLGFDSTDFFIPLCNVPVTLSATDTIRLCGSVLLDGGANHDAYEWSTGDTTRFLTVTTSGTYSVGIRDVCCTGADTVVVIVDPLPAADFAVTSTSLSISLSDSSTGGITAWAWDFGDGNTSTMQNPSHTYTLPGTYTVCLVATNGCGSDTLCQPVTVTCPAPAAQFSFAANELDVTFTDLTPGTPNSWFWDFGDGIFDTLQNPQHSFATPGTYTVCLTVSDICGTDTICDTVSVTCPAPSANFSFFNTPGDSVVAFTIDSFAFGDQIFWDFGDGSPEDTTPNPSHTYSSPGIYTVCLAVYSICGADTVCDTVNISLVGRLEHAGLRQFEVFPVPTAHTLSVRGYAEEPDRLTFTLTDLLGREVKVLGIRSVARSFEFRFDLEDLAVGTYLLRVSGANGTTIRKVLKE